MAPLALTCALALASVAVARITDVVLFGDSYTDQSRSHSISNGTFPGKNYQQVYPPADNAADGGFQWPFYLGLYGNYTISNYAVGGSVCSNDLTPLFGNPDVLTGQQAWFIEDHISSNQTLLLDPDDFVVIIWIGTNDVGIHTILTSDTPNLVSLADVADCQFEAIRKLHDLGARRFILNSMIPLHLTRLYADSDEGTIYWPDPHNGTVWHKGAYNLVRSLNRMLNDGVQNLNREWKGDGKVELFDTYRFFEDMYNDPGRYFNGSLPANVTGHCHQCPDPHDWRQCDIGDCTLDQRDSFMWWDELHPSEQSGRNLANEMNKKINGESAY
ncbi:hypothetical protein V5O48_005189 [Marasmius crinis-equi]|uniref:Carbohydrate esterase family 16 protein n=1 Tax=Marasmius crinis-equi TaxID=585013 RepID=A0ABR3FMZ1_9AGAR